MISINEQRFVSFIRKINNRLYENKIVILIGKNAILCSVFIGYKLHQELMVNNDNIDKITILNEFLKQFKGYYAIFLLDNDECLLRHENVPVLQSLVKINPVEDFIENHFTKDNIVAYNVHTVSDSNGENWSVSIASTNYFLALTDLLDRVLESRLIFGGIYFSVLENINIINHLSNSMNINAQNAIQIWITTLKTSGIKCVIKFNNDILVAKNIEYPSDKNIEYIQGIIEQEVTDSLLLIKRKFAQEKDLAIYLMFMVDERLQTLLKQTSFENTSIFFTNDYQVTIGKETKYQLKSDSFYDSYISAIFLVTRSFLGVNSHLKELMILDIVNKLLFKPLISIFFILSAIILFFKLSTGSIAQDRAKLHNQYQEVIKHYRNLNTNPDASNFLHLVDVYSVDKLLSTPKKYPFEVMDKVLALIATNNKIELVRFNWQYNPTLATQDKMNNQSIELVVKYKAMSNIIDALSDLEFYMQNLRSVLPNYKISHIRPADGTSQFVNSVSMLYIISISE